VKVPHSIEAEASVLGNVLVHPRKFVEVAPLLDAADFFHPAHRAVYEALLELDGESKPLDVVTLIDKMRALGTIDRLRAFDDDRGGTGEGYLIDLMARVVTVENTVHHAGIVRSRAERRRRGDMARELAALALDEETGDDEFAAQADAKLVEMASVSIADDEKPRSLYQVMTRSLYGIEYRSENRDKPGVLGIPTGFKKLDALTTGPQPGELWILAARPGMGKSTFASNMLLHAATVERKLVDQVQPFYGFIVSLEMSDESLGERMISSESGVGMQKLRTGDLDRHELVKIVGAAGELSDRKIWIDPKRSMNIAEIRARVRRWRLDEGKSTQPCQVVVDYLQLVSNTSRNRNDNREQEIAAVSRGLKTLAGEINGAVIALSQLSRKCEERGDKRPMLSDLRESGAIEQDADVVAFIYRDEVYSKDQVKDEDRGIAEIIVAKQRNGPTGTVKLRWQGHVNRFVNLEEG
jgi:replicative DNA helicase